jgi:hypothetical protein
VEHRPGIATRCAQYCAVMRQCQALADGQWQPGEVPTEES